MRPVRVDELLHGARALLEVGRWADARVLVERALAAEPDSAPALTLLAHCCELAGEPAAMLAAAERAIAADPAYVDAQRYRASALARLGRIVEALAAAREGVRLAPHSWPAHYTLAATAVTARQYGMATEAVQQALRLAPANADVHALHGTVLAEMGLPERARAAWQRALAEDPGHARARAELAADDALRGAHDDAATGYAAASAERPADAVTAGRALAQARSALWRIADLWLLAWLFLVTVLSVTFAVRPGEHGPIHDADPRVRVVAGGLAAAVATWFSVRRVRRMPAPARRRLWLHLRRRPFTPGAVTAAWSAAAFAVLAFLPRTDGQLPEAAVGLVISPYVIGSFRLILGLVTRISRRNEGERITGPRVNDAQVLAQARTAGVEAGLVGESVRRFAVLQALLLLMFGYFWLVGLLAVRNGHIEGLISIAGTLVLQAFLGWAAIASLPPGGFPVAWAHVRRAPSVRIMAGLLLVGLLHDSLVPYGWIESPVGRWVTLCTLLPAVLVPVALFAGRMVRSRTTAGPAP